MYIYITNMYIHTHTILTYRCITNIYTYIHITNISISIYLSLYLCACVRVCVCVCVCTLYLVDKACGARAEHVAHRVQPRLMKAGHNGPASLLPHLERRWDQPLPHKRL